MSSGKKYWKGIEDLQNDPDFLRTRENEFPEELPVDKFLGDEKLQQANTSRRDFLKFLGFSTTAAVIASCQTPVVKSIPYLVRPDSVTPGVASWYATSYFDGDDYCDVLVKCREGRPIKIEGNELSPVTRGAVNARVHASLLSLYDTGRLNQPVLRNKNVTWDAADREIGNQLSAASTAGGGIRILTSSVCSPAALQLIEDFRLQYTTVSHVMYDAVSYSAIRLAHHHLHGKKIIPSFNFAKAEVIASFGADFLSTWLSPVEFTVDYSAGRKPGDTKSMSYHVQYESVLTLTGSNADDRVIIKPSEQGAALLYLYNLLAGKAGKSKEASVKSAHSAQLDKLAVKLWNARGKSLVVCGANDLNQQLITAGINDLLGNYGNTIDESVENKTVGGDDEAVSNLIDEMKNGKVSVLITWNTNPAYSLPPSLGFAAALSNVKFKIALADRADETAILCDCVCPTHHFLESWGDASARTSQYALQQPAINPLYTTRQAEEIFLRWMGKTETYYEYLRNFWQQKIYTLSSQATSFDVFWNTTLQNGCVTLTSPAAVSAAATQTPKADAAVAADAAATNVKTLTVSDAAAKLAAAVQTGAFEMVLYCKTGMGSGRQSNNPWLQEFPDPITKATWDNYITMSPKQMDELGLNTKQGQEELADIVDVSVGTQKLSLPVLALPGQAYGTVGVALGYGRTRAGKVGSNVGGNAYTFSSYSDATIHYESVTVSIGGSTGKMHLATTQTHHTMMGREIVKETNFQSYKKDPASGNPPITIPLKEGDKISQKDLASLDLWANYKAAGQTWNLAIDLTACTGCGSCVISCQAENNVAVVGKDEVRRGREMHWMRIDRYYTSDTKSGDYSAMEIPSEHPEVVFQPVMCQHCNHASCETVCPVLATSHSTDGLNQMTYNRCVGTRYCANNCPYKVRRFNWFNYADNPTFDYNMNSAVGKMVLNPDVVVRSRGVMEKCSLCVHRIQEGRLKAKMENRVLSEDDITPACAQSCPAKAIVFGDVSDEKTKVSALRKDPRRYFLLEEVGVQPNVFYMTKIRNKEETSA